MIQGELRDEPFDYSYTFRERRRPSQNTVRGIYTIITALPNHTRDGDLYVRLQVEDIDRQRQTLELNPDLTQRLMRGCVPLEFFEETGLRYVDNLQGQLVQFEYDNRTRQVAGFSIPPNAQRRLTTDMGALLL
ncbi:hypothetical protein HYV86_02755 [Candidatus Woesearchaeota archaeon]|nr:hypothetical protein [Candidatus Woesearchaeota archaeon]